MSDALKQQRLKTIQAGLARRHRSERIFHGLGVAGVTVSLAFLALLLVSIVSRGLPAFWQHTVTLPISFAPEIIDVPAMPQPELNEVPAVYQARLNEWKDELSFADWTAVIGESVRALAPDTTLSTRELSRLVTSGERFALRDVVMADPRLVGTTQTYTLLADANVDVWLKGDIDRSLPDEQQQLPAELRALADRLKAEGRIQNEFSTALFMNTDSRSSLASAGLSGAIMGTVYLMLIVMVLSVPVGVATAIYLQEFARQNRFTDFIEVNINNLAAVPSIVFGLLGAAVFINLFQLPISAPIVGGLVLTLMTLPTVIITTRASLAAVPPSIRQAALGIGASKVQMVFHHVLPLALPGILTGAIIGVAQAIGETAPLLLIGMSAFVAAVPTSPMEQSTALPVQIYLWQANELRNFFEGRTAAAIMVLLTLMVAINGLAIWLRKKLEVRW